ncbi:MAG TPA: hypothetical protein ENN33_01005 [Ignavibacteria bacterium]|nr:hypothetical protein [Ignavibacteria bacterium]
MRYRVVLICLASIALLCIRSKNAIILFALISLLGALNKVLKKATSRNYSYHKRCFYSSLLILLVLISAILFVNITNYFINTWNMGLSNYNEGTLEAINALTSNRINVYSSEILRWSDHFIFGNGLAYQVGSPRSHNWIIDLLVQSGLVGTFLYFSSLTIWYLKIHIYRKVNRVINACFWAVIIFLLQGLAEVSIFTITVNIILWSIIGLSVSEAKVLKVAEEINE